MKCFPLFLLPLILLTVGCTPEYTVVYRGTDGRLRMAGDGSWNQPGAVAFGKSLEAHGYAIKGSSLVTYPDAARDLIEDQNTLPNVPARPNRKS